MSALNAFRDATIRTMTLEEWKATFGRQIEQLSRAPYFVLDPAACATDRGGGTDGPHTSVPGRITGVGEFGLGGPHSARVFCLSSEHSRLVNVRSSEVSDRDSWLAPP